MIIVFRSWYFVGMAGLVGLGFGGLELRLSLRTAADPEPITIAQLEQGERPSQPYVRIDEHFALFRGTAYETRKSRVKYAIYPVLSSDHPWLRAWHELGERYDDLENVPEGERPQLGTLGVFAFTKRFSRVEDIPEEDGNEPEATGILHEYSDLTTDEIDVLKLIEKDAYKQAVVIELGRRPRSIAFGGVILALGIVATALAIRLFVRSTRRTPAPVERADSEVETDASDSGTERSPGRD